MLRSAVPLLLRRYDRAFNPFQVKTFLTQAYSCTDIWNERFNSPILQKVNLDTLYNEIEQNGLNKGIVSAIDIDIFANAVNKPHYLDELRDLLHKLRLSADSSSMLESTHYAAVRNFLEYGDVNDLIDILDDRLNYGVFLDAFTANILLDSLIKSENFTLAAKVASFIMLQEDYSNKITNSLCLYSCYRYLCKLERFIDEPVKEEPAGKVEELKIRVRFLRNDYFDDHFDLKELKMLAGKTLAWIAAQKNDALSLNLQIIGWLFYRKYDKMLECAQTLKSLANASVYKDTLDILSSANKETNEEIPQLAKCIDVLSSLKAASATAEDGLKLWIEDAVNKYHNHDIEKQKEIVHTVGLDLMSHSPRRVIGLDNQLQDKRNEPKHEMLTIPSQGFPLPTFGVHHQISLMLFKTWDTVRAEKLTEQISRLDRAKRIELITEKMESLKKEEQKLWFFENEDKIDLQIEGKKVVSVNPNRWLGKKKKPRVIDEAYIPPEI